VTLKTKNFGKIIALCIVMIVLLFITFRKKSVEAQYVVIKKQEVLETVLASGKIAGRRVVPLSFIKSGIVVRIYTREDALVKEGDTLISLENNEEKNRVSLQQNAVKSAMLSIGKLVLTDAAQAQAQLEQAVSSEDAAKKQFERISSLYSSGAVAQQEFDQAKRDYDVALKAREIAQAAASSIGGHQKELLDLQLRGAQLSLEETKIELSRTVLRAPESGRVIKILVNAGELVSPSLPVISFLPSDTTTHVELQVDEDEVFKIKPGQRTIIGLPALAESTFSATVRDVVPFVDATRGTIMVQCATVGTDHVFIPDQTVSAQIITGSVPDGIALEKRFVIQTDGAASVFLFSKGKAENREVLVKDIGNSLLLVNSGLVQGDTVLFGLNLASGAKVKLKESR